MARHLGLRRIYGKPQERPVALDLQALPQDLIRELADVVVTLDRKRILEVIARISEFDETIAQKLAYFADRYAYTPILVAAEARKENSQHESP
jgi:hypothetical protein